ncbi:hypothetical protein [Streptomyces formicae]
MPEPPEPIALYRYFDADDALLYIGISNDPDFRAKAHLYESRRDDWPKRAVRRTDEWLDSREVALAAEKEAIRAERPLYNGTHNYDEASFDPAWWPRVIGSPKSSIIADLMRREISCGAWPLGTRIPSLRTLAGAAGLTSSSSAGRAAALLKAEGLLDFEAGHGLFVARLEPLPEPLASDVPVKRAVEPKDRVKIPHDWFHQFGFPG